MMEAAFYLSMTSLFISILALILAIRKINIFKWEYYEDGIKIYNKNKKVTIETDKELKK